MKRLLLPFTICLLTLTSCLPNSSYAPDVVYIVLLTKINVQNHDNSKYTCEFTYGDISDNTSSENFQFTSLPVLKQQSYTSSIYSNIKYKYKGNKKLIIETSLADGSLTTDSMLYNNLGMVNRIYVNNQDIPFRIAYNSEGYRTQIGNDTTLMLENGNYTKMNVSGFTRIEYHYSSYKNLIGLQQFGIPGAKEWHYSEHFGRQSYNLLSKVVMIEKEGITQEYKFSYIFDGNGFVMKQTITRDNEPFMITDYSYRIGIITMETDR